MSESRIFIETPCEHGLVEEHFSLSYRVDMSPSVRCPGGVRRELTIDEMQERLDTVITNLLPEGHGMVIDVAFLLGDEPFVDAALGGTDA